MVHLIAIKLFNYSELYVPWKKGHYLPKIGSGGRSGSSVNKKKIRLMPWR